MRAAGRAVISLCLTAIASAAAADEHPLWGMLDPGPHPIGFRVKYVSDPTRAVRPELTLGGTPAAGDIDRRLTLAMWHPAGPRSSGMPVRFGDYVSLREHIYTEEDRRHEGVMNDSLKRQAVHSLATYSIFTGVPESAWHPLLQTPMRAMRDAKPAPGKFPLVLLIPGALGSAFDMPLIAEYLASHGFVVLSASAQGQDFLSTHIGNAVHHESQARDAEYLLGYATSFPFIDRRNIGLIGFSRGAAAAALLTMRNPVVDAMVSWDGSIGKTLLPRLERSAFYDPGRLTVPLLSIHIADSAAPPALFEQVRYAGRYVLTLTGIHHVDFMLGMVQTSLGARNQFITSPPEQIRRTVESIYRFTRAFLEMTLKRSAVDLARVASDLEPRGVFQFQSTSGRAAPPSAALLLERIHQRNGITSARTIIEDTRRNDPEWIPFPENVLGFVGSRFEELGRAAESLSVLELNAGLYPKSAGAWIQLAAAQEKAGDPTAALRSYTKALEIDPANAAAANAIKRLGESQ